MIKCEKCGREGGGHWAHCPTDREPLPVDSQSTGSVSAPTVSTDPVLEAIAKKLFGINTVPPTEQSKMIKRAAKAGAEALRKQNRVIYGNFPHMTRTS